MQHIDLFSGIGGFALAARRVGWRTVQFVENDPFCQNVLRKNFPGVPIHDDVESFTSGPVYDSIVTAGWPCQDISSAGTKTGLDGERSGLWEHAARILGEVRPRFAVLENVSALLGGDSGRWFQRVLGDMAALGFHVEWHCIPACAVGAPHRRDRVWLVAYTDADRGRFEKFGEPQHARIERQAGSESDGLRSTGRRRGSLVSDASGTRSAARLSGQDERQEGFSSFTDDLRNELGRANARNAVEWWSTEPGVGRMVDGFPDRVDRLRGLGNAIVPQIAETIFAALEVRQNV